MKRIYIAGPYSSGDTIQNVRTAVLAGDKVAKAGYYPFIPHLTHFWHFICPHEYEFWLDQDIAWLLTCDYLVRLPGESSGADKEVIVAFNADIPVFFSVEACLDWITRYE